MRNQDLREELVQQKANTIRSKQKMKTCAYLGTSASLRTPSSCQQGRHYGQNCAGLPGPWGPLKEGHSCSGGGPTGKEVGGLVRI
jgi:hypothetical protein